MNLLPVSQSMIQLSPNGAIRPVQTESLQKSHLPAHSQNSIPILERMVGPQALDFAELLGPFFTTMLVTKKALNLLLPPRHLISAIMPAAVGLGAMFLHRQWKRTWIENQLSEISQQSLGQTKKILILDSMEEGLRDMPLRSTVAKIRQWSQTHSIIRKRILE